MNSLLTREQVEHLVCNGGDDSAVLYLAHDAALRARVEHLEQINFDHELGFHAANTEIIDITTQLAALTQTHQQLQDTVEFQEAQYIKEHEHWGECQWKLKHQQAVNENREWVDKWDAHDHYPHGYVHAQIGLRERTEAQFQAETLRTSMLAQLLIKFAKIYSVDHFQEAWPKACHRCDLLKETKQALELPVNTAWDDHLKLKVQLQQAVEALKAWEHWYDQDASEFNRDTARAMGVKFLATHKEQG